MRIHVKTKGVRKAIEKLREKTLEEVEDTVESVWYELAYNTPRDTGQAQHSWAILGPGERIPPMPRIPEKQRYTTYGSDPVYPGFPSGIKLGSTVRIVSRVPYMVYLNQGWSKKAPALFIEKAVAKAR